MERELVPFGLGKILRAAQDRQDGAGDARDGVGQLLDSFMGPSCAWKQHRRTGKAELLSGLVPVLFITLTLLLVGFAPILLVGLGILLTYPIELPKDTSGQWGAR